MAKTKVAMVAKQIRAELKEKFPTVKFSVRSSNYSMGCSINVKWTDLPTVEAVEEVTNKFRDVSRCEFTGEILSGGNMYVFTKQSLSPELVNAIESQMEGSDKDFFYQRSAMNRIMNKMWTEQKETKEAAHEEVEASSIVITQDNTNEATLNINEEKQGIEIKFVSKPSESIITALKQLGFKYSVRANLWWAKNTIDRLTYTTTLVETFNDIIAESPMEDIEEVETVHQVEKDNVTMVHHEQDSKIKVEKIVFEWSESAEVEDGHTVYSFAEANEVIRKIAKKAPDNGAYDKTKFIITFADGQTYEGRYDVTNQDMFNGDLSKHVIDFAKYSAGIEKPSHMSQSSWESMISDTKDSWIHFYNSYQLEDDTEDAKGDYEKPSDSSTNNIVLFNRREENVAESIIALSAEQQLKLQTVVMLIGEEECSKLMKEMTVDMMFSYVAKAMKNTK